MHARLHFDPITNILHIRVEGPLTMVILKQIAADMMEATEFPPTVPTLWNFTRTDLSQVDESFMRDVIEMRKLMLPERSSAKLAILANSDLNFGLGRMYASLSATLSQPIQVFRDEDEAVRWLMDER